MTEYYGKVDIQSRARTFRYKDIAASTSLNGSGNVRSNDLQIAQHLSENLTNAVDNANSYVYDLHKRVISR